MMHKHEKAKRWFVTTVLGASMIVPAGARAARADDVADRAAADMDRLYNRRLSEIRDSNMSDSEKISAINALMADRNAAMRSAGMSGRLNQVGNATRSGNNTPGFWDKAGTAAIGIIGELLKAAITNWMNNPTKENEARIAMLEAERDRLMNERNNPTNNDGTGTNGTGRPVYDSNGNIIGWDRDGDGRVDSTDNNGDGRSDGFNGGSNENGYADPYEYLDGGRTGTTGGTVDSPRTPIYDGNGRFLGYDTNGDGRADSDLAANTPTGDVAGGNANVAGGGPGGSSGAGGDEDDEDEEDEEDKDKDDKDKKDEELATADGKDGVKTGEGTGRTADGKRDRNGDGKDDELQMETLLTRVVVVPKVDPLAATGTGTAVGSARPGTAVAPAKPLEDNWNDTADNGDRSKAPDEWGDEWGEDWGGDGWSTTGGKPKPNANGTGTAPAAGGATTPGMGATKPEDAQLVDELIRVETVVAEWRKVAKEEAEGKRDPYGFHDGAGYQGSDGMTQDPLAEFRGPDGKLDLTRVDVWLVERDSWKEGMEPRRFKVTVSEEALETFDPISGGYMMARGVVSEMKLDPRVLAEIKGSVKKFDLVQVVLSSETPPEDPANAPPTPGAVPAPSTAPSTPAPTPSGDDW